MLKELEVIHGSLEFSHVKNGKIFYKHVDVVRRLGQPPPFNPPQLTFNLHNSPQLTRTL